MKERETGNGYDKGYVNRVLEALLIAEDNIKSGPLNQKRFAEYQKYDRVKAMDDLKECYINLFGRVNSKFLSLMVREDYEGFCERNRGLIQ